MSHVIYDATPPGGAIVARSVAKILEGVDGLRHAKTLADEVGNMTTPFSADNFLSTNNGVFSVQAGHTQAFYDQLAAITSAINTALSANSGELNNRLHDLYQN